MRTGLSAPLNFEQLPEQLQIRNLLFSRNFIGEKACHENARSPATNPRIPILPCIRVPKQRKSSNVEKPYLVPFSNP